MQLELTVRGVQGRAGHVDPVDFTCQELSFILWRQTLLLTDVVQMFDHARRFVYQHFEQALGRVHLSLGFREVATHWRGIHETVTHPLWVWKSMASADRVQHCVCRNVAAAQPVLGRRIRHLDSAVRSYDLL